VIGQRQDPLRKLPDLLARLRERDIKEKEEVRSEKVEGKGREGK